MKEIPTLLKNQKTKSCMKSNFQNHPRLLSTSTNNFQLKIAANVINVIYQIKKNLLIQTTKTIIKYYIEHKQVINYSIQLFENALSA